jgi:hypothetical protein
MKHSPVDGGEAYYLYGFAINYTTFCHFWQGVFHIAEEYKYRTIKFPPLAKDKAVPPFS